MNIHSQARTTPKIREEIRASKGRLTLEEAAKHFNVSRSTILKWRKRESVEDRSHRPRQIHTALTPLQEEIVVLIRRSLLLTVDDLLVVTREFIKPDMVRSSLIRLLNRHGVNRLQDLYAEQSGESETDKPKSFKDYEPGYLHVDIKYLPNLPNDPQKRYLLVAIDRATRWVYLEVIHDKSAKTTAAFIRRLHEQCSVNIKCHHRCKTDPPHQFKIDPPPTMTTLIYPTKEQGGADTGALYGDQNIAPARVWNPPYCPRTGYIPQHSTGVPTA